MSSKLSIHQYPSEYSTSQSSWTGGMVSYEAKRSSRSSSNVRKGGSDSVPYEYQPHQSKTKKPSPTIGTNNDVFKERSSSALGSSTRPSMKATRSQQQQQLEEEESPRSTTSSSHYEQQQLEEEEEMESKLWEFPLMYIQKPEGPYDREDTMETKMFREGFKQTSFYGTGMMRNQENVKSHNMPFRTGKSVVFSMDRIELSQYTQTLPLYVFLFILTASPPTDMTYGGSMADPNMGRSNWKPVLIGSISIPLNELRVTNEMDAPKGVRVPQKRTISGTFTIKNDRGYDVGVLDMDVRLRSLVKAGPINDFNEYLTHNFSKSFSLQRPMTGGGPHSGTMDRSVRMQTGAVTRNPLFTVTDNTFNQQTQQLPPRQTNNSSNPMNMMNETTGELGQLSTLVQHYKETQAQTMMMRGQIENQISTMANQLADISRQLKGEPERFVEDRQPKKVKKKVSSSGKVLNSKPISKRPSSANPTRTNSLSSSSSKNVDTLSKRTKNVSLGRNTNSYLEQPTKDWYHVLHGTSTVRKPQSASSSTSKSSSSIPKKKPMEKTRESSSSGNRVKSSKKENPKPPVKLEEELARHVLENLQQQEEDDEREGTTLSGVIPKLTETLKQLARKSSLVEEEEEPAEEMITIPSEMYRTIKENNDRYNNLQKSYRVIMEEFVDNPNKLFSSVTQIDTRGMSLREKELWKNQTKLITLLKDNYTAIKQEKDMSALKDVTRTQIPGSNPITVESSVKKPSPRRVEEIEDSTDSSSSDEEEKKKKKEKKEKKKAKEKKEAKENKDKLLEKKETKVDLPKQSQETVEYPIVVNKIDGDHDHATPVIIVEESQDEDSNQPGSEEISEESNDHSSSSTNQVQTAEDFFKQYDDEESEEENNQQSRTNNLNPMEMANTIGNNQPLTASIAVSEIKTDASFGDFEDFDNSQAFDTSEVRQSDTLKAEDFSVVHVSQEKQAPEVEEEEFDDFDNDFEEEEEPEDENYEEQQDGHTDRDEVIDSVDYSAIEDRTEEERI